MTNAEIIAKFRIRFPEFDAMRVSDEKALMVLEEAQMLFSACGYLPLIYLMAHIIVMDEAYTLGQAGGGGTLDGGTGMVTSETVGSESVTVTPLTTDASDAYYSLSEYGRRFLALRDACPSRNFSVRVK